MRRLPHTTYIYQTSILLYEVFGLHLSSDNIPQHGRKIANSRSKRLAYLSTSNLIVSLCVNKGGRTGCIWQRLPWNVSYSSIIVDKGIQSRHIDVNGSLRVASKLMLTIFLSNKSASCLHRLASPFDDCAHIFSQVTIMAVFRDPYTEYHNHGLQYEFITEIAPKVWKIYRKNDRMEYLAQDVTDTLFTDIDRDPQKLTDYGRLLRPDGHNMLQRVEMILNHPNLVCLVDHFALQQSNSGRLGRDRWFMVWDYCDAGNLGNLLVPSQPRPQDRALTPQPRYEDEDVAMHDAPSNSRNKSKFLPESLCWHVLTSVLKALAWLHDGVRDIVQTEDGVWERRYEDLDWQPMLHRDISPQNIFMGHPRRREWYGPVKLGNYGRLFVSSHCQTPGHQHKPVFSKAIGPPPENTFARLKDMVSLDAKYGSVYPFQPGQPYTMVSEYRAIGEIIQAMMIEPTTNDHIETIQSKPVKVNLETADYSGRLKNFVVKLMQFDPWHKVDGIEEPNPTYVTSDLYREAQQGVQWFSASGSPEADVYVTAPMAEAEDYLEHTILKASSLVDSFKNVEDILEECS
ncbi:hypothetical protein GGS21DRAFT_512910 [Xylaria nigripes]|nr:hypothetical protein GGS21DRAFT_512910 [Xylaria nigripes]